MKTADQYHYQPQKLDDAFSRSVFDVLMLTLDAQGLLFAQDQFLQLSAQQHTIADNIIHQHCSFVDTTVHLYLDQLRTADSLLRALQSEDIRTDQPDSLALKKDSVYVPADQLAERWRKYIKLQILSRRMADTTEDNPSWARWQREIFASQICRIQTKLDRPKETARWVREAFLKAVALAYDPHTTYFSYAEEQAFENLLSKQSRQYGLQILPNAQNEMEIATVVPGSSAWNSNQLNEGDVILSVQTAQGTQDFSCIGWSEARRFLSDNPSSEATFRVRKPNGRQIEVTLFKELVEAVDNAIQSFTLRKNHKVGYIYLPSFYTNAELTSYPRGCANDLAKELIRLKREGINGLILDLRNNGGGSLSEAVQLAGGFVDYGAVALADARQQKAVPLKDMNRGTVYDGPMVVLIDRLSASASELLAATLQDYHRAVIVGATSFGKATAQQVVPLDDDPASGYLKVTVGNFYRITGSSHQGRGVVPDIVLPTIYDHLEMGESTYATAFAPPPPQKKAYYSPLADLPLSALQARSQQRQHADSSFLRVERSGRWLGSLRHVPLDYPSFKTYWHQKSQVLNGFITTDRQQLQVSQPSYLGSSTETSQQLAEKTMVELARDPYVRESYHIVVDLIDLSNN